jgi:hypothetical protein
VLQSIPELILVLILVLSTHMLALLAALVANAPVLRENLTSPPSSHRISFLHYHKTGHDLSRILARGVSTTLAMHLTKAHHQLKRERFDSELSCSGPDEVQVWTAPELFQRVVPVPSCNIVVHMVRDPASWAISSYDYHRQDPTPEAWVKFAKPKCAFKHRNGWNMSAEVLRLDAMTVAKLMAACKALVQPGETYWQHLSTLPEWDGLRLMAFMNILGGDNHVSAGDLTRSAANALSLKRAASATPDVTPPLVTTLWMDEVLHDLKATMAGVADFLVSSLRSGAGQDEERRRLTEALVQRLASALVTAQTTSYQKKSNGSHVTSLLTDIDAQARKARLAASLYNDTLLGPVYRTWSRMIHKAGRA